MVPVNHELISSCWCREQTSLLSIVKLAAQILSLLVLTIALILAFRRLTTNNTGIAIQTLPEGNVASTDGVTNSSNYDIDNIQLALNFNAVWASNILWSTLCFRWFVRITLLELNFPVVWRLQFTYVNCPFGRIYVVWICCTSRALFFFFRQILLRSMNNSVDLGIFLSAGMFGMFS